MLYLWDHGSGGECGSGPTPVGRRLGRGRPADLAGAGRNFCGAKTMDPLRCHQAWLAQKSPIDVFLGQKYGKSSIIGGFSIAMLEYRKVMLGTCWAYMDRIMNMNRDPLG